MSSYTINYAVSRIRESAKASKEDSFITDRYIYSVLMKYGESFTYNKNKNDFRRKQNELFTTLDFVEMIEVDKIEADCIGIKTNCNFMRSLHKLPNSVSSPTGNSIRSVMTLDGSEIAYKTDPKSYVSKTKLSTFKYDTTAYYWIKNGYLYIPNRDWELITIDGIWDDDIDNFLCDDNPLKCKLRQEHTMGITSELFAEIEQLVIAEITNLARLQTQETSDNKQNILR